MQTRVNPKILQNVYEVLIPFHVSSCLPRQPRSPILDGFIIVCIQIWKREFMKFRCCFFIPRRCQSPKNVNTGKSWIRYNRRCLYFLVLRNGIVENVYSTFILGVNDTERWWIIRNTDLSLISWYNKRLTSVKFQSWLHLISPIETECSLVTKTVNKQAGARVAFGVYVNHLYLLKMTGELDFLNRRLCCCPLVCVEMLGHGNYPKACRKTFKIPKLNDFNSL